MFIFLATKSNKTANYTNTNSTKKIENDNTEYILLSSADVTKVKRGSVSSEISFIGDLLPIDQTIISSEVDAQVLKVFVSEGQFVKKGQLLALLESTDLRQALAGQEAMLASSQAKFKLDKNKLEKQKELYKEGFISKFAYNELQTNYTASFEAIRQQQSAVERAQKQLSNTIIKAPFDGYIYQKNVDSGQIASKNGKLFALANLDRMQIKASIPSEQIGLIALNQEVIFKAETSDKQYQGKISRINPVAEAGTRSYMIYIEFNNKEAKLQSGQFVKGKIILHTIHDALYVPSDAIHKNGLDGGLYVLKIDDKNLIKLNPVTVILSDESNKISAISGLEENILVIKGNVLSVKVGDKVKVSQ